MRPRLLVAAGVMLAAAVPALPAAADSDTATPIKHVVVIFQENVSFDHYFGTYPYAANPSGEPAFTAAPGTPGVDGLDHDLLTSNPNLSNPQRLDRSQARTCDQDHNYTDEQAAFDGGRMDQFVQKVGNRSAQTAAQCTGRETGVAPDYAVMDYYDGNTVTAFWNYAQRFAMSDHQFQTGFGPSTVGALNLVAGNTYGATCTSSAVYCAPSGVGTVIGDPQPAGDKCDTRDNATMKTGRNVGDLLNARDVTWGWFEGGFASCSASHTTYDQFGHPHTTKDYIPHHEPFQYYASTANPQHLPPTSTAMIGHQDQANHQYDLGDFWAAVDAGGMPAVSFLKAAAYQDGHAGYSGPLDEQTFLVETLNRLQQRPEWASTAVLIAYDDSDGWYDHLMGPVTYGSQTSADTLDGAGVCGKAKDVPAGDGGVLEEGRCGVGPRLPLLLLSPFARTNFVDHHDTTQSSILRFIEDNWQLGRIGNGSADATSGTLEHLFNFERPAAAPLLLDPSTGERV